MREIKFRAWDKSGGFMDLEPFVYGEYYDYGEGESGGEQMPINKMFNDDNYIFMQYIGLKDKNGKEIYEGDIVKDQYSQTQVVEWFDKLCWDGGGSSHPGFYFKDGETEEGLELDYSLGFTNIEVIGNIYENPELVKEG